jgi:adhesin/invasin
MVALAGVLALACNGDPTGSGREGSAATSIVTASNAAVISGESVSIHLVVNDASGGPVGRGGDVVVFGLSGGTSTGVVSGAADRGDGTYVATVVGQTAGTPMTVTATLNGASVTTALPTIAVVAGGASPATSLVSVSSATLDVGSSSTIRLEAFDAAANRVTAGGLTVTFADSGGTSQGTIGPVTDHGDGSYSADYSGEAVGTEVTVLATMAGVRVTTPAPTLAVTAGPPSPVTSTLESSSDSITLGSAATLTLRTRDASGTLLSLGGRSVVFSVLHSAGTSDGVIETDSVDLGDGSYTARFRGTVVGGPVPVSATIDGKALTTPLPTIAVVAVEPSAQNSVVSISDSVLTAGDTAVVTLRVKDIDGNDLAATGLSVAFSIDSTSGRSWGVTDAVPVTDNGDGSYTGRLLAYRA